jgi:hypothetical protein
MKAIWTIAPAAAGTLSFFLCAAVLRDGLYAVLPERFDAFQNVDIVAADPRIDIIFVGSSRIKFGIRPEVFDDKMAARGIATRSYNIAEGGLSLLESMERVRGLLEEMPCCLKHVFLEPDYSSLLIVRRPDTMRAIRFFNAANAYMAFRFMSFPEQPPQDLSPIEYSANIARGLARHYSNVGMFHVDAAVTEATKRGRGYPLDDPRVALQYEPGRRELEDYKARLAYIASRPPDPRLLSKYHIETLLSFARYTSTRGADLVLLRPPQVVFPEQGKALIAKIMAACTSSGPIVLDFSSPAKYPALFDPKNRFDEDHLNATGAAMLSELAADAFAGSAAKGTVGQWSCGPL